jgi:CRISPR-associated protein Csx10
LKQFSGFWNCDFSKPEEIKVEKSIRIHTGIDRTTGTVAENILFAIEAIDFNKTPYLVGIAKLTDKAYSKIYSLLSESLFIGKAKTRGYGEIKLNINQCTEKSKNNYLQWSNAFKSFVKSNFDLNLKEFYFSISLQSDAIILDKFLRYSPNLEDMVNFPDGVELITKIAKMTRIRGWNYAYGLPKDDEWGIEKGSVFLYKYNYDNLSQMVKFLNELEKNGIGIRKEEGFGRLKICDEFHVKFQLKK